MRNFLVYSIVWILLHVICIQVMAQETKYYMLFSARFPSFNPFSIGGHAFVTWRSEDTLTNTCEQFTYGFYPTRGNFFRNKPGLLAIGYIKNSKKDRLVSRFIIEVDSTTYANSLKSVQSWRNKPYHLFHNNCLHFMDTIAAQLGLIRPSTYVNKFPRKPQKYIKLLKKLNASRIIKNNYLESVRTRLLKQAKVKYQEIEVEDK